MGNQESAENTESRNIGEGKQADPCGDGHLTRLLEEGWQFDKKALPSSETFCSNSAVKRLENAAETSVIRGYMPELRDFDSKGFEQVSRKYGLDPEKFANSAMPWTELEMNIMASARQRFMKETTGDSSSVDHLPVGSKEADAIMADAAGKYGFKLYPWEEVTPAVIRSLESERKSLEQALGKAGLPSALLGERLSSEELVAERKNLSEQLKVTNAKTWEEVESAVQGEIDSRGAVLGSWQDHSLPDAAKAELGLADNGENLGPLLSETSNATRKAIAEKLAMASDSTWGEINRKLEMVHLSNLDIEWNNKWNVMPWSSPDKPYAWPGVKTDEEKDR